MRLGAGLNAPARLSHNLHGFVILGAGKMTARFLSGPDLYRNATWGPRGPRNTRDMSRSVLLVEDDARVRRMLRLALQDEGYDVQEAEHGEGGLRALGQHDPDVVLLDVLLPDEDGFSVCRAIRQDSDVPVIMVTARTDSHDVVAGLESGADDYVTKPVAAKELSARIRALLRRSGSVPSVRARPPVLRCGSVEIRVGEGVVLRDGTELSLTRIEFRLLVELASVEGQVCSREYLLDKVWGYGYFGDGRIVDVHIGRLRSKVERDPANPALIVTARGLGYRLVC